MGAGPCVGRSDTHGLTGKGELGGVSRAADMGIGWREHVVHAACMLLMVLTAMPAMGQNGPYRLQRPQPTQGMPRQAVLCFLEDQQGFLWLGTQDGLYRFDGYGTVVYRANPLDATSLSNGYIWDLHQTADGSIWVATFGGGLNRLDPVSGRFEQFRKDSGGLSSDRVFAIGEDSLGLLWLGTQNGLNRLNPASGSVKVFGAVDEDAVQTDQGYIGSLAIGPQGAIWFSGTWGLARFDPESGAITRYTHPPFGEGPDVASERLGGGYALRREGDAVLLMCRRGMLRIEPGRQRSRWVLQARELVPEGKAPIMRTLYPKAEDGYWIGTNQGLLSLRSASGEGLAGAPDAAAKPLPDHSPQHSPDHSWIRAAREDPTSLPDPTVHAVCRTRDGVTWIGTQSGVAYLPRERAAFQGLAYNGTAQGPVDPAVTALAEGPDGRIWMATYGGLSAWNPRTDAWTHWPADARSGPGAAPGTAWRNSYLLSLCQSRDGSLWIGSRGGGLHRIPPGADAPRPVDGIGFDWSRTSIHAIHEDRDGMLWLGTGGSGLLRFDPRTDSVRAWPPAAAGEGPSHPYVFAVHEDRHGNLWLGTATGGLNLFDRASGRFHYFQHQPENPLSLSNDLVLQLYEDRQNRLWVATAGGLHRFVPALVPDMAQTWTGIEALHAQPWFLRYGAAEGFPSEVVYGILEQADGRFWAATGEGLARFDPATGRVDRTAFRVDGLPADEGMQNGFLQCMDGRMAFSTAAGPVLFHPDSIRPNPVPPKLALTDVLLYNEAVPVREVQAGSGKHMLQLPAQPSRLRTLRLGWQDDVLSFRFAALHFSDPAKNRCRYRLLGYDRDWLDAGPNRTATYTNLPGGRYTLEVMGSNADGIPAEAALQLPLVVQAPPWARWWAWVLYAGLLLGLFYAALTWRVRQATRKLAYQAALDQARQEGQEQFRRQSAEDFHDEAGSSITKINLFAALAREEAGALPGVSAYLDRIEQHSHHLSQGMRDFLWALDPRHDSLYDTLDRFIQFARSEGELLGLTLDAPPLQDAWHAVHLSMPVRKAVTQGLKEAFHNAVKHAEARQLTLTMEPPQPGHASGRWVVLLHDNGKGFDAFGQADARSGSAEQTTQHDPIAHYGLSAQQARCRRAGVDWGIDSAPGHGTTVRFGFTAQV